MGKNRKKTLKIVFLMVFKFFEIFFGQMYFVVTLFVNYFFDTFKIYNFRVFPDENFQETV